jgi:hypothetical protein
MTEEDRMKFSETQQASLQHQDMLKDIMMRTRATGNCVESFFQQFGSKMHQGLTQDQFNRAILNLKVPWAED